MSLHDVLARLFAAWIIPLPLQSIFTYLVFITPLPASACFFPDSTVGTLSPLSRRVDMFAPARWSLRLPRPAFRALSTRNAPQRGPRGRIQRPSPPPRIPPRASQSSSEPKAEQTKVEAVSNALSEKPAEENELITPVHIPEDPHGVLREAHPATSILANSAIIIQRQLEMMNVLVGFEQANRYVIMDPQGNHLGYLAEQDHGLGSTFARQMFRTHRSFTTHVFDRHEKEVLRFHRPFSWISSRIRVYDAVGAGGSYASADTLQGTSAASVVNQSATQVSSLPLSEMRIIGAAEQQWAPLRRKYNLFLARDLDKTPAEPGTAQLASGDLPFSESKSLQVAEGDPRETGFLQFSRVDEPFLSWDFTLLSEDGRLVGSVNRNFAGFARELFTDTGVYALRMDAAAFGAEPPHLISKTGEKAQESLEAHPGMTLDQRAVMLATAVSIDFDYFSRHSGSGGGMFMPMWLPFGGEAAAGGAAAEAGAVGAASEAGIASEAGAAARGLGATEGMAAGAGTMAGYEAMQRGREAMNQEVDSQSPTSNQPPLDQQQPQDLPHEEDVWGQGQDPWANNAPDSQDPFDGWGKGGSGDGSGGESGGGDGGGGDDGGFFSDWF